MLLDLGRKNCLDLKDYAGIGLPCLLLLGDNDKMVTTEETEAVYKAIPGASFKILPGTAHPIERINVDMLKHMIANFIG
jgi:pimeloyl-ACP methyl ester carboxylesterase